MKKLMFVISALFLLGFFVEAKAELSAQAYTGKRFEEQQVFTLMYNISSSAISANAVVILDKSSSAAAGSTLGTYIIETGNVDDVLAIGIADESISAGSVGRVCVRGPHKALLHKDYSPTIGQLVGNGAANSDDIGTIRQYAVGDGVAGGVIGTALKVDADDSRVWYIWVNPYIHK